MDKYRCKEVRKVYDKLAHMHREPWTHRGTSTADPVPLSTWGEFRNKRYGFIKNVIVLGLEDPGTLPELIQYTRGELRGAALERRRVVIPQIVFVKHVLDALREHSQHDVWAPKLVACAHDSGFSKETIEGLKHFGIHVFSVDNLSINDRSLVVDLRTEQERDLHKTNMTSIIICDGQEPPGAILKRSSTMKSPSSFRDYYYSTESDYKIVTHFELPSQAARMLGAEKARFRQLKALFRRGIEDEIRYWEVEARQNGDQAEAAEQSSLLDEDEQRLTQLSRNLMVLLVQR